MQKTFDAVVWDDADPDLVGFLSPDNQAEED